MIGGAGTGFPLPLAPNARAAVEWRAMLRRVSVGFLVCAATGSAQQRSTPTIELKPGLVITQSARVAPGVYQLPTIAPADSPIIVIRGDDITVDFAGATMEGTPL